MVARTDDAVLQIAAVRSYGRVSQKLLRVQIETQRIVDAAALVGEHPPGVDPVRFHLIAPYDKDSRRWIQMNWIDQYTALRHNRGGPSRK